MWQAIASSSDGTKLIAAVYSGNLYTSTDSGMSWTARESSRAWWSVASSADGSRLVATETGSGGRIYTSIDSGETWTVRGNVNNWRPVASSSSGSKLVAALGTNGMYTSP
jgi:hypothetical protein